MNKRSNSRRLSGRSAADRQAVRRISGAACRRTGNTLSPAELESRDDTVQFAQEERPEKHISMARPIVVALGVKKDEIVMIGEVVG